ncbi:MAG: hypothetical protein EXQ53_01715 [Acidobacteria bacterium]|nr:hypothetical protein [Acidobacteriota bacterium]
MLRLGESGSALLADKVSDAANVAAGAMVFGQFLSERPLSILLMVFGGMSWVFWVGCGVAIAEDRGRWKAR